VKEWVLENENWTVILNIGVKDKTYPFPPPRRKGMSKWLNENDGAG
jgi:hypothetical protein